MLRFDELAASGIEGSTIGALGGLLPMRADVGPVGVQHCGLWSSF